MGGGPLRLSIWVSCNNGDIAKYIWGKLLTDVVSCS